MNISKLCSLLFFLICSNCSIDACGQVNLNVYNGLPSNHVYQMVKDRYGYLWMATTNGVVRYNGYDLRTYSVEDGLPSNDVWSIHLDKRGRLWLLCFSNTLGYIYKNKYHETYVDNNNYTLSTNRVHEHPGGIAFITKWRDSVGWSLFRERNDTIVHLKSSQKAVYFQLNNKAEFIYGDRINLDKLYTYTIDDNALTLKGSCAYDSSILFLRSGFALLTSFYNFEIGYIPGQDRIYILNYSSCASDTIKFPGEGVSKVLNTDKHLYVFAGNRVYQLDSNLRTIYSGTVGEITEGTVKTPPDLIYLLDDNLWGKAVATQSNGLYLVPKGRSFFKKVMSLGSGYKYVGYIVDSVGIWWNGSGDTIAYVSENGTVSYRRIQVQGDLRRIVPLTSEKSLMGLTYAPAIIDNKTGATKDLTVFDLNPMRKSHACPITDIVMKGDTVYTINSGGFFKCHIANDAFFVRSIHQDRCTGIINDSVRQLIWAYNPNKIILYKSGQKPVIISGQLLKYFGIRRIEQILSDDRSGNILIKDGDKLYSINFKDYSIKQLFHQYDLSGAKIVKRGDMLIAVGGFGVSVLKKTVGDGYAEVAVYLNEKYRYYRIVHDVHISPSKLMFNTDNGFYSLDLPHDTDHNQQVNGQPFKLVLAYAGDVLSTENNDSLLLNQNERKLVFDIIKPSGSGVAKYQFKINGSDTGWQDMTGGEMILSDLDPGRYYTLLLRVRDDVWKSNAIPLHVYVIPFWWQTSTGRSVLWLVGILLLSGLILTTVAVTRRIIVHNNLKKNKLLELELKSIYSQINPHFIFNTLNTTLHYIVKKKLDEAYDHVSSFSSLLRGYLKSSRNRYITLGEEIANLRNYIHLQQTRFENAFTYEIRTEIAEGRTIDIPSLLLQPIVENAINHGLLPKNAPGHLKLSFISKENSEELTCIVDDNGIGRRKAGERQENAGERKVSYGDQLIRELVEIFNKYENAGIEIKYIDKELPDSGTTVIITIKNARSHG